MVRIVYVYSFSLSQNTPIDELLAAVYSAVIKDSGINPSMLGDIVVGKTIWACIVLPVCLEFGICDLQL